MQFAHFTVRWSLDGKERDQPVALALQSSEAKNLIFAGGVTAFAGAAGVIEFGIFKSIGPALVGVYIGYAVSYLLYVRRHLFSGCRGDNRNMGCELEHSNDRAGHSQNICGHQPFQ